MKNFREDKLMKFIDWVMVLDFSIIIILVTSLALLRYLFKVGFIGGSEMGRYLYIFASCLGMGILLRRDEHVKIDIVINLMPTIVRKLIIILNNLIITILNSYLIYLSISWIRQTGMVKSEIFDFPIKHIQVFLPTGFSLVVFFALCNVFDTIYGRRKK
jgi:TRAP-type transport system small permease protein